MDTTDPKSDAPVPVRPPRPLTARTRWPGATGMWVAVLLALLGWSVLRSLGPLAIALGAWVVAGALPRSRDRRAVRHLLLLLGVLWILHAARWVVYPLLAAMLVAMLLAPLVSWLESKRVHRSLATLLVLLPFGLVVVAAAGILVPAILRQGQLLLAKLPDAYAYLAAHAKSLMQLAGPEPVPTPLPEVPSIDSLRVALADSAGPAAAALPPAGTPGPIGGSWLNQLVGHAETVLRAAIGGVAGVGRGLGVAAQYVSLFLLTPIVAYHLLVDREQLRARVMAWLPDRWREHTLRVAGDIGSSLQVYLRGQSLVAAVEIVLFSVVFAIAGFTQPVALGVIAGLLSLVPLLGFWITVLLVVLNAVTGPGPGMALLKAGVGIAIINFVEGQLLVPRIQGSGLGLHPLAVLLGVLLFGALFGFVGVLLAVPAMGVLRAAMPGIEGAWFRSSMHGGSADQTDSPGSAD